MKRAMCVFFPHWPLQRLLCDKPTLRKKPVAIIQPLQARKALVLHGSSLALRLGVEPGMPAVEAAAIAPHVHFEEEDPAKDREALEALAAWAERYSPFVGLEEKEQPDSLFLDISGAADCFHGEDNLLARVVGDFRQEGWLVRSAAADTLGAAWALAHYANDSASNVVDSLRESMASGSGVLSSAVSSARGASGLHSASGATEEALANLPVAGLRIGAETQDLLRQLGLQTIGDVLKLPRRDLAIRFPLELVRRLDQALGKVAEVIQPHPWKPLIEASFPLEDPIEQLSLLNFILEKLTAEVETLLRRRHLGARHIECRLSLVNRETQQVEVGLFRPTQSAQHLWRMITGRLEKLRIEEPVCALSLRVVSAEPLPENQGDFFDAQMDWEAFGRFLDQLSHSLGKEAVLRVETRPEHQPELACQWTPVVQPKKKEPRQPEKSTAKKVPAMPPRPTAARPLKLWARPAPIQVESFKPPGRPSCFRWGPMDYQVLSAWGPERIETGWWRGQNVQRDYFVVATHRGDRFWIFENPKEKRWYVHGVFD
jgi:protein ImuB